MYDGDGRRVAQTINGVTTYFVGGHYEVTGSQVTKYYFAGTTRIAMRKYTIPQNMTVEYFLGDHPSASLRTSLGSTSITTDANGAKVSEMRYKPWGEIRYSWTAGQSTTPAYKLANYTYTGQYSYTADFGLMFYNARWYDPYLNHFTQPDSIVPDPYNSLDWNRYAYARYNPLKYTDPSGHKACDGAGTDGGCDQSGIPSSGSVGQIIIALRTYGVKVKGKWDTKHAYATYLGVADVGDKLARTLGGSAESAFHKVFKDGVNFTWGGEGAGYGCTSVTSGGCTSGASQINFWSMSNDMVKNVVHELGHAFYHAVGKPLLGYGFSRDALIRNKSYGGDEELVWEQHPISMNDPKEDIPTELFADTFIAWTYDTWNSNPKFALAVNNAQNAMDRIAGLIP